MADVLAVFGVLVFLGCAYPALLLSLWLWFPGVVERARQRLEYTPWKSFWMGVILLIIFLIPLLVLISRPGGVASLLGWGLAGSLLAFSAFGGAGLAALMSGRLAQRSSEAVTPLRAFLGAALALELTSALPLLGWFVVLPVTMLMALGASAFAWLRRAPRLPVLPDSTEAKEPFREPVAA